jgi:hypothetical protein
MESLFPPALSGFLGSKELTIFMLACGALVRVETSFKALALFAKR